MIVACLSTALCGCDVLPPRINHLYNANNDKSATDALTQLNSFTSQTEGLAATLTQNLQAQQALATTVSNARTTVVDTQLATVTTDISWLRLRCMLMESTGLLLDERREDVQGMLFYASDPQVPERELARVVGKYDSALKLRIALRQQRVSAAAAVLRLIVAAQQLVTDQARQASDAQQTTIKNLAAAPAPAVGAPPAPPAKINKDDVQARIKWVQSLLQTLADAGRTASQDKQLQASATAMQSKLLAAAESSRDPATAYALSAVVGTGLDDDSFLLLDLYLDALEAKLKTYNPDLSNMIPVDKDPSTGSTTPAWDELQAALTQFLKNVPAGVAASSLEQQRANQRGLGQPEARVSRRVRRFIHASPEDRVKQNNDLKTRFNAAMRDLQRMSDRPAGIPPPNIGQRGQFILPLSTLPSSAPATPPTQASPQIRNNAAPQTSGAPKPPADTLKQLRERLTKIRSDAQSARVNAATRSTSRPATTEAATRNASQPASVEAALPNTSQPATMEAATPNATQPATKEGAQPPPSKAVVDLASKIQAALDANHATVVAPNAEQNIFIRDTEIQNKTADPNLVWVSRAADDANLSLVQQALIRGREEAVSLPPETRDDILNAQTTFGQFITNVSLDDSGGLTDAFKNLDAAGQTVDASAKSLRATIDSLPTDPTLLASVAIKQTNAKAASPAAASQIEQYGAQFLLNALSSSPHASSILESALGGKANSPVTQSDLQAVGNLVNDISKQTNAAKLRLSQFVADLYAVQADLNDENARHFQALLAVAGYELARWQLLGELNDEYSDVFWHNSDSEQQQLKLFELYYAVLVSQVESQLYDARENLKNALAANAADYTINSLKQAVADHQKVADYWRHALSIIVAQTERFNDVESIRLFRRPDQIKRYYCKYDKKMKKDPNLGKTPDVTKVDGGLFPATAPEDGILSTIRRLAQTARAWHGAKPATDDPLGWYTASSNTRLVKAIRTVNGHLLFISENQHLAEENTIRLNTELAEHSLHLDAISARVQESGFRLTLGDLQAYHATGVTDADLQAIEAAAISLTVGLK